MRRLAWTLARAAAPGAPRRRRLEPRRRSTKPRRLRIGQAAIGRQLDDHVLRGHHGAAGGAVRLPRQAAGLINFVYTSCSSVCPTIVQTLDAAVGAAQQALGDGQLRGRHHRLRHRATTRPSACARSRARRVSIGRTGGSSAAPPAPSRRWPSEIGFVVYPAPQGFDHLALTTVVDQEGRDLPADLRRRVRGAGAGRAAQGAGVRPPAATGPASRA